MKIQSGLRRGKRLGFSMVELVVVVLVLGIIAAIAAPKFFNTAGDARDNGTKLNLTVVRDALELYKSQSTTDSYPAQATITADLKDYIRGPFPAPEVGDNKGDANVADNAEDPIATPVGTEGWIYNDSTGEFRVNDASFLAW